jgi:hypothetical protein
MIRIFFYFLRRGTLGQPINIMEKYIFRLISIFIRSKKNEATINGSRLLDTRVRGNYLLKKALTIFFVSSLTLFR